VARLSGSLERLIRDPYGPQRVGLAAWEFVTREFSFDSTLSVTLLMLRSKAPLAVPV